MTCSFGQSCGMETVNQDSSALLWLTIPHSTSKSAHMDLSCNAKLMDAQAIRSVESWLAETQQCLGLMSFSGLVLQCFFTASVLCLGSRWTHGWYKMLGWRVSGSAKKYFMLVVFEFFGTSKTDLVCDGCMILWNFYWCRNAHSFPSRSWHHE